MFKSRKNPTAGRSSGSWIGAALLAVGLALATPAAGQEALRTPGPDAPPAPGAVALSVEEAVARALESHEEARIARVSVDRTEGLIREAFARALPSVDGTYRMIRNLQRPVLFFGQNGETEQISISDENEHAFSLSVEQPIFDRSLGAGVRAARHGRAATEAAYERALSDVELRARRAYYDALLARARVRVRENALRLAEQRLDQVRLFHDVGTVSEFDLLTAQVAVESERPPLIQARNAFRLALNSVKRVTGLPLERDVELSDTLAFRPIAVELEEVTAVALAGRADLEAQKETVDLNEELVKVEASESYPTLSLLLDLTRRASSADFVPEDRDFSQSASAALELRIPVFDGREAQGRTLQARADYMASLERLRALERDVRLQVLDAWQSVGAAAEAVEASQATIELARRAHEIAVVRFRNGLSTQLELDEAEQDVVQAETDAAEALYDHMLAVAQLENAIGGR
ncbi:MAG: TolC family protein [Gemmatimonadetes bacterium]|nr:TolC family protein [Gemmatimonadota bacterium]